MHSFAVLLAQAADLPGDSPRLDAELLLASAIGKPRSHLLAWPERTVSRQQLTRYEELLGQRRRGIPVAYLLGRREFWNIELAVSDATLIPRSATETLVEWALALDVPAAASVLDLGTGSGAIALALAASRAAWAVTACDASTAALDVACDNAKQLQLERVEFVVSNWFANLKPRRFSLIVANPPYIAEQDPHLEAGDLRFEPRSALVAGVDGLSDIRRIAADAPVWLAPHAWLLIEHGAGQGEAVRAVLRDSGLQHIETRRDLEGHERVSGGQLPC